MTRQQLETLGQAALLEQISHLSEEEQQILISQINSIDSDIFQKQQKLLSSPQKNPQPFAPFTDFSKNGNEDRIAKGKQLILQGKVGALIVAGGQGTRLKFEGPKGMFRITDKTLFQIFADKVPDSLPLAIMTSPQNHEMTVHYFKENHYFGLDPKQIDFFHQQELPMLNDEGNLFLTSPTHLAMGPDGNGHALRNFVKAGLWDKWHHQGVEYLNFLQIDNPLAEPYDPELVAFHQEQQCDVVIKCVERKDPSEKVGVLVKQNDHVHIVEYSEISKEEQNARDANGVLKHRCANISLFSFGMPFVKRVSNQELPMHLAYKDAKSLGGSVKAWKFERFIFDVLSFADGVKALLYPRKECYAPLKSVADIEKVKKSLESS